MLVYRGMDIGTPADDRTACRVPHHLIDLAEPNERFTVTRSSRALGPRWRRSGRGAVPLVAGGSGLYYRAVVDDLEFPGETLPSEGELEEEAQAAGAAT